MNATTRPRIPRNVMGFVAVPVRKEPGIVAHRVERLYDGERTAGQLRWEQNKGDILIVPACLPKGQMPEARHHELSPAMADSLGAVACTEQACFPEADTVASPSTEGSLHDFRAAAALGIRADQEVWVAAARAGIEAHRIDEPLTGCGRSTRTGERLAAADAAARHRVTWCRRCWPRSA